MKVVTVYPCGIPYERTEYTASEVLMRIACQGLTEMDINGKEISAAEVAADFPSYMHTSGSLLAVYLNNIITKEEHFRASALWHMLRYGNLDRIIR